MALPSPALEYCLLSFPSATDDHPYVILNMVASADGKATAGTDESALSSSTDKLVLQSLRIHADAILNGAGTARTTGVNPAIRDARLQRRRQLLGRDGPPIQAVLSVSGVLPADASFLHQDAFRVVLFVNERAQAERVEALRSTGKDVRMIPDDESDLSEVVRTLRQEYGVRLLLLEGGPGLNAEFFHKRLIDEFFTTVGPHIVAGRDVPTIVEGMPFDPSSMPSLELVSAYPSAATSEVYLHWRVRRDA